MVKRVASAPESLGSRLTIEEDHVRSSSWSSSPGARNARFRLGSGDLLAAEEEAVVLGSMAITQENDEYCIPLTAIFMPDVFDKVREKMCEGGSEITVNVEPETIYDDSESNRRQAYFTGEVKTGAEAELVQTVFAKCFQQTVNSAPNGCTTRDYTARLQFIQSGPKVSTYTFRVEYPYLVPGE
ncbi:MAG: hypothetical protein S4CHLAM6_02860 [Chlamydiae bacterium]|nr:hypothetical protein [Chlamydiota bacterium]